MDSKQSKIEAMANAIYTKIFGHLDDKRFADSKTTENADWLAEGDTGTMDRSVDSLADEWREYDAEEVERNA